MKLIQMRFRIPRRYPLSRKFIFEIGREWIRSGKTPPGIVVDPIVWGKQPKDIRKYLKRSRVSFGGCPGVVKHYAEWDLILLDFDIVPPVDLITAWHVFRQCGVRPKWIEYSRTRRGWHVALKINRDLYPAEIVAFQAILGSDPARETFNLARVLSGMAEGSKRWNLLFEYKL